MSKTKKENTGHYEVLYIIPNKFTDEEAKEIVSKVEGLISKSGAEVSNTEYWGKKKLSYEIKHNSYGYYSLAEFNASKEVVASINQALRLSSDIIRHQIVAKRVKSEAEIKKNEAIQEKIDAKKDHEEKEEKEKEEKREEQKAKKEEAKKEDKKENKKENKKGSKDIKDLDQKLEGILNAQDLI